MCYGKYASNDPCAPFCSKPDGSGCDYSPLANPSGANPFGKTGDPYSVTYSDQGALTGNFTQRTYVPTIDPYQVQTPPKNFHGFASNREEFMTFADYSSDPCPFVNQSGTAESITQDGKTTTLTAVPRFSTRDFFQSGQMNGLTEGTDSTCDSPKFRRENRIFCEQQDKQKGQVGLGDGIEIAVMTGADGSKSLDKLQEGMSETMKGLLGLTIVIGSIYFLTGLTK